MTSLAERIGALAPRLEAVRAAFAAELASRLGYDRMLAAEPRSAFEHAGIVRHRGASNETTAVSSTTPPGGSVW
jgi:hypothetical protein